MNAGTFNNNPQENAVPTWLLQCTREQLQLHDATATLDPNPTSCVLKNSHTKVHRHHTQEIASQYSLLNSHTQMIDSHMIQVTVKSKTINH